MLFVSGFLQKCGLGFLLSSVVFEAIFGALIGQGFGKFVTPSVQMGEGS